MLPTAKRLGDEFDDHRHADVALDIRTKVTQLLERTFEDMVDVLRPAVIVEVGAFEADVSRRMRKKHQNATIWAFEANPRVYGMFADGVRASGVHYEHLAIGAHDGVTTIHIPERIANAPMPFVNRMASLNLVALRDSVTTAVEVPVSTLDAATGGSPRLGRHALWIDVEGAVDKVLRGADSVLNATDIIACKLERRAVWKGQALAEDVVEALAAAGFRLVVRDCRKWFQFNAIFIRNSVLESSETLRSLASSYEKAARLVWRSHTPPVVFQYWNSAVRPAEIDVLMKSWEDDRTLIYKRFDQSTAETFIDENFDDDVSLAFRACHIPAMQADVFRLCVLYVFGGVYLDADIRNLGTNELLMNREGRGFLYKRRGNIANDFMVVHRPEDKLIAFALEQAVANIRSRTEGNVWTLTGPGILTSAFNRYGPEHELFSGFQIGTVAEVRKSIGFVWDLAYKKSETHWTAAGNLSVFGNAED